MELAARGEFGRCLAFSHRDVLQAVIAEHSLHRLDGGNGHSELTALMSAKVPEADMYKATLALLLGYEFSSQPGAEESKRHCSDHNIENFRREAFLA